MRSLWIVGVMALFALVVGTAWVLSEADEPDRAMPSPPSRAPANDLRPTPDPDAVVHERSTVLERAVEVPVDRAKTGPATLEGEVILPDGQPAAGYTVRVRYPAPLVDPETARRDLDLPPLMRWDPAAEAAQEAAIDARMRELSARYQAAAEVRGACDAEGRFRFEALRAPAIVDVLVDVPSDVNVIDATCAGVTLLAGELTRLPPIRLEAGARIEGVVVDSFNEPIAGAEIRASDRHKTTSSRSGSFAFQGLPGGTLMLEATHPNALGALSSGARVRAVRGRSEFVRLVLPRAAHVSGAVTDLDGAVIDGAKVTVRFEVVGAAGLEVRSNAAASDARAAFDVGGIRVGAPCLVAAEKFGYAAPTTDDATDTALAVDAGAHGVALKLRRLSRVRVKCIDAATRTPMTPDSIALGDTTFTKEQIEAVAIGIGVYDIPHELAPGREVEVTCRRDGYIEDRVSVTVRQTDVVASDVRLARAAEATRQTDLQDAFEISGRVIDGSRCEPVASALVEAVGCSDSEGDTPTARTTRSGTFRLSIASLDTGAPDGVGLRVTADGYATSALHPFRPDRPRVSILLWPFGTKPRTGTVFGGVIGRDGQPATRLLLTLGDRLTTTDAAGMFRFDGIPVDCEGSLDVADDAIIEPWATATLRDLFRDEFTSALRAPPDWRVRATATEPIVQQDIDLRPYTGSLRGTVYVNDTPAPDVDLRLEPKRMRRDHALLHTRTRADGTFEFPLLIPVEGKLVATRAGRPVADPVPVRVNYADDAVAYVRGAVADIGGTVHGITPQTQDLPIVRIDRVESIGPDMGKRAFSDTVMVAADGTFSFLDVPAGRYLVSARSLRAASTSQEIAVTANGSQTIGIDLFATVRVVLDAVRKDFEFERVTLVANKKVVRELPLASDLYGRLVIDDLPPGKHLLVFSTNWWSARSRRDAQPIDVVVPADVDEYELQPR